MDWNPNRPEVIGLEFPPRSGVTLPAYRIDADGVGVVQRLDSTVTETVSTLGAFVDMDTDNGIFLAEVLDASLAVAPAVTTTIVRPSEVVSGQPQQTAGVQTQAGSTTNANLLAVVNRAVADPSQYVTSVADANPCYLTLQFDMAGVFTGRRILDVRVIVEGGDNGVPMSGLNDASPLSILGGLAASGGSATRVWLSNYNHPHDSFKYGPVLGGFGELQPPPNAFPMALTQPWTVAQLEALDDTGAETINLSWASGATGYRQLRIFTVRIEVDHIPENRLARNQIQVTQSGRRWQTWTPAKPDGSANYAKVSGTDPILVIRRPYMGTVNGLNHEPGLVSPTPGTGGSGDSTLSGLSAAAYNFLVPYIESLLSTGAPTGLEQYRDVELNSNGTIAQLNDPAVNRIIGTQMAVAGTQSVDAQPFVTATPVTVTGTVQQEVSGASGGTYAGVFLPARYTADGGLVGDLTVRLRRRSDNVTIATATITKAVADVFDPDTIAGWRMIQAPFAAPGVMAAAAQYYLDFTAAAPGSWEIAALTGIPALGSPVTGVGSYDGTTDVATYGGGDVTAADIAAMVYVEPSPIVGSGATAESDPVAAAGAGCTVTAIGKIALDWTATGDPELVVEIQRSDDTTDWQTIAVIADSAVSDFDDYEARISEESCYRFRTVSTVTGIVSAWSTPVCATRGAFGCGYTFTSNEYPDLNVAYGDVYDNDAVREYEFPEANERVFRKVYGRDYQIGFRPMERRGMTFTRLLLITALATPDRLGPSAFDRLRDLAAAATSYVCVCDEDGNRWYAAIDVPRGRIRRPGELAYAEVEVTEVTDLPSVPDVASL